jgi:hypothetical protein
VLTADIVHAIQHSLVNSATDQVAAAKNVQAQLQYLTADDDYQSLIDRNTAYDMFASGSINALYESVPGASEFSQTINDTITQIVYIYCNDPETMEVTHLSKSTDNYLQASDTNINLDTLPIP